jgi:hypothetical protein
MLIQLREQAIIGEGFFGKVFLNDGCAIKVFKKPPAPTEQDLDPVDNDETDRRRKKFKSEVEAYQKAQKIDELLHYTSHFIGERVIARVFDIDNNDVTDHYFLDCAYAMDYLKVKWIKYAPNSVKSAHVVKNTFKQHGINAMNDFSFYLDGNDNVVRIIDFAIEEYP